MIAAACLVLWVAASAHAATLVVGPGQPLEKIQDAVDQAAEGDTVLLLPWEYREHVVAERGLSIVGQGGPAATRWRGSDPETWLFHIHACGQRVRLEGIDFSGEAARADPMARGVQVLVCADGSQVEITDCWVHDFDSANDGLSTALQLGGDTLRVNGYSSWSNEGDLSGGGAILTAYAFLELRRSWFANNTLTRADWYGAGANAYASDTGIIEGSVFLQNGIQEEHGATKGGGLSMGGPRSQEFDLIGNVFEGNEAKEGGGTVTPDIREPNLVQDNLFIENHARAMYSAGLSGAGGGLQVEFQDDAIVTHNLFIGNTVEWANDGYKSGSALDIQGPGSYVGSNIFTNNSGGPAIVQLYPNQSIVANLVHANPDGDYGGAPFDVQLEVRGDPLFFAPDLGDYRLRPGSPCIDAGDPDPPAGIDSLDADGTRRDIGPIPFDQSDFDLLYVVPHSTRAIAGGEAVFRVLVANLADQPRDPELLIVLVDSAGEPVAEWRRPIHFPPRGSWHDEVTVAVPPTLAPGRYLLRVSQGSDIEEIEMLVAWSPGQPVARGPEP